jgi:hypothetical protein
MTPTESNRVYEFLLRLFASRFEGRVSDWCAKHLVFNEPKLQGPFSFVGREYLREPLDDWANQEITDMSLVFGTRTGKTRIIMGGMGWRLANDPMRALWVLPNTHGTGGAKNMSRTRWRKMLESSPELTKLIPDGKRRFEYSTMQQMLAGSIIDFGGSNSPANLAGNPCDVVVQDEVDKFKATGSKEADASYLADQRAKEFANPKRIKASTPTLETALMWQEFLKSDMRRRFVPCPHCGEFGVFAWSKEFSVFEPTGNEFYIKWDADARGEDGKWDLDKVEKSAHYECWSCKKKITDDHKVEMDARGQWRPTRVGASGYRGYHLPSMYSLSVETTAGKMARRFLLCKNSAQGLRGFINSDLAEPYKYQDRLKSSQVVVNSGLKKTREGIPDRTARFGAGDRQKGVAKKGELPHWWHLIWDIKLAEGKKPRVRIVSEGKELTESNLVRAFEDHEVIPSCVILDSSWDTDNVYALCMDKGYYCLKAEGEQWFAGHADGGKKIYAPPKPLHTILQNRDPKYDYIFSNGVWVPHPQEPMFIHAAKYPMMDFFTWLLTVIDFEVPEDVSDDFKSHMNSWGVEDRIKKLTNEKIRQWKQYKDRDDMFQLCCYLGMMMLDAKLIEGGPVGLTQEVPNGKA